MKYKQITAFFENSLFFCPLMLFVPPGRRVGLSGIQAPCKGLFHELFAAADEDATAAAIAACCAVIAVSKLLKAAVSAISEESV